MYTCVCVCVRESYPYDLMHTHSQIKRRVIAILLLRCRKSKWIEGERAKTRFSTNCERICTLSVDYTTIEENSRTRIKLEWFNVKWGSHTQILWCDLSLSLNRITDNCVNSSITAHKINNNGYGYSVYISVRSSLSLSFHCTVFDDTRVLEGILLLLYSIHSLCNMSSYIYIYKCVKNIACMR